MRVIFRVLPEVSITGRVRDYEPVTVSTSGMTTEGFYVEVETDEEEMSVEIYIKALKILIEQLQDVVIEQVDQIIHKRLNPPSSL